MSIPNYFFSKRPTNPGGMVFDKIRNRGGGAGVGLVLPIASIAAQQGSIHNRYVAGSGVGATSSFARRAKMYRAKR